MKKGFKVYLKLGKKFNFRNEELEGITEIHYNYDTVLKEKRIAFESDILNTGITYDIKDIIEFEAIIEK